MSSSGDPAFRRLPGAWLALVALMAAGVADADLRVCRLERLEGFDAAYGRATKVLESGPGGGIKVFVTVEGEWLYLQSNHTMSGYDYPTKLATDETGHDLRGLTRSLVWDSRAQVPEEKLDRLLTSEISYFVEDSVLQSDYYSSLSLGDARRVFIVRFDGSSVSVRGFRGQR